MKKRLIYLILPVITLILEIIPYGVVLNFGRPSVDGEIGYFREFYSYFDIMPLSYGHFCPILTACLTCLILVLLIIYCLKGSQGIVIAVKVILCLATFFSIFQMFIMGIKYITLVGVLIAITLIAEILIMQFTIKNNFLKEKKDGKNL